MQVNCPQCKTLVEWHDKSTFRPFCSKRCQLIDLGEWSEEQKTIPGQQTQNKDNVIDIEDIEAMLAQSNEDFFSR